MAGLVWTGVSGDLAGNGLAALVSDDEVFFPATAANGPSTNMATWTAVDADLISVMRGVTYSLGGSGNNMKISADKVEYRGTAGKLWLEEGTGANPTDWVVVDSTASDPIAHDCFAFTGATLTHLDVIRGWATILATATVTEFIVGSRNANTTESKLTIDGSATSLPLGILLSGIVSASSAVTTVEIHGGSWTQILGVPTTIKAYGGTSVWKKAGTVTTCYAGANAVLDFSQADGVTTITTLYKHPTARIIGWTPDNNGIVIVTNSRAIWSEAA